jgi:hypothetical protein
MGACLTTALETHQALSSPCKPRLVVVERRSGNSSIERAQLATTSRFARHTWTVSVAELTRASKISRNAVRDIVKNASTADGAAALPRLGRQNTLVDADKAVHAELSEEPDRSQT